MIKKHCDRCGQEILGESITFRVGKVNGLLDQKCAAIVGEALDGTKSSAAELAASMAKSAPTKVGTASILWEGERWIRMSETVAPESDAVPNPGVRPHEISQAIGAAPEVLTSSTLVVPVDPSIGAKGVAPAPSPSHDEKERALAALATTPEHQPFVAPLERDDLWKPGDRACSIHACPYRAIDGSNKCKDHAGAGG